MAFWLTGRLLLMVLTWHILVELFGDKSIQILQAAVVPTHTLCRRLQQALPGPTRTLSVVACPVGALIPIL